MIKESIYKQLCNRLEVKPTLDIATDSEGSNKLCVECITCVDNAFTTDLRGKDMTCNSPFTQAEKWIQWLEINKAHDITTKCLLFIPHWKDVYKPWFDKFLKSNLWRCVYMFEKGTDLFTRPRNTPEDIHDLSKRESTLPFCSALLVFQFNDSSFPNFESYDCAKGFADIVAHASKLPGHGAPQYCSKCRKPFFIQLKRHERTCGVEKA
jgi:hypothetical protein